MLVNICSRRIKQTSLILQDGYLQMHFTGVLRINKKMAFDLEKVCHQNSSSVNKVATKLNKDIADRIMCESTKISKIRNLRKSNL